MGPTILSQVEVNGVPTDALIDTGSPATSLARFCHGCDGKREARLRNSR